MNVALTFPKLPGEPVQLSQIVVADFDLLLSADVVREWTNEANIATRIKCSEHSRQPTGGDERVVVEEQNVFATGRFNALISSRREPLVVAVFNQ